MLPNKDSTPVKRKLSMAERCGIGRYIMEEEGAANKAERWLQPLWAESRGDLERLGAGCGCSAARFWPRQVLTRVHHHALEKRTSGLEGALGCCQLFTSTTVRCLTMQGQLMEREGDLGAAGEYYRFLADLQPSSPKTRGFMAFGLMKQGRFRASVDAFGETERLEAGNVSVTTKCGKALAHAGLGNMGAAEELVQEIRGTIDTTAQDNKPRNLTSAETCVKMNKGLLLGLRSELPDYYRSLQRAWEQYEGGVDGWQSFLETDAVKAAMEPRLRGRRLLFLGHPELHLPSILKNLGVLRKVHGCDWPAEYWLEASEVHALSEADDQKLASLSASVHILPSPYGEWDTTFWNWRKNLTLHWQQRAGSDRKLMKYALKAVVLVLSSCDECLFVDGDSLTLAPPQDLLPELDAYKALFWPDMWDAPRGTGLWKEVKLASPQLKSQESGQLLVKKTDVQVLAAKRNNR
eukprot:TRINITY_DN21524_c0_g1_i4.p1 TRINITY_DN21524_c0_g1~~TRINITY_DN21524_c0_g1_i4.p1  ORF type:complete len:464 (+),score=104.12 TRINITY_DN21524_c0_g1_i4:129-1520(+)